MSWYLAAGELRCHRCGATIAAGQPFRLVTVGRWIRCRACAKQLLGEDPPTNLEAPPSMEAPRAQAFVRISREAVEKLLPFDVKSKAAGND